MRLRRCVISSAILPLLLISLRASAGTKRIDTISAELPAGSALCVVCNNVQRLTERIRRMERRITGRRSQVDEFTALKMVLGPYWNTSGPLALVLSTPAKGKVFTKRDSVVIFQATNTVKFVAGLKNGAVRGGITPARIEGTPAYLAIRKHWIFLSPSRSELKHYLQAKAGLALPARMDLAMSRSDITIEGDSRAIRKVLFLPLETMIFAAMRGNQWPVRSPALRAMLHQIGSKMGQQISTALERSALTVHFGRAALVINLINRVHANSPVAKMIASQPALPANALTGLPNLRYSLLYADRINGEAISHWLKAMLPVKAHTQARDIQEINTFLAAVADHIGTRAIVLPPLPSKTSAPSDIVNPWAVGPSIIIEYSRHPKAQMHNLETCFTYRSANPATNRTKAQPTFLVTPVTVMGDAGIRVAMSAKKREERSHTIELINIGSHRVLAGVNTTAKLLKASISSAKKSSYAIAKRPGLAQSADKILPESFAVMYLPLARWNQLQNTASIPKAAHALTLGLPPPPAVFSVGTGKKSLNMQLYIPVATLEQSLSGNSAGALF